MRVRELRRLEIGMDLLRVGLLGLVVALGWLLPRDVWAGGPARELPRPLFQGVVRSTAVVGTLPGPGDRHVLTLVPFSVHQPLALTMDYIPQGQWQVDDRAGFFLFDLQGYAAYRAGTPPGSVAVAAGAPLPGQERRLFAQIQPPVPQDLILVVYNDARVGIGYRIQAQNGEMIDHGAQVASAWSTALPGQAPDYQGSVPVLVPPRPTPTPLPTPEPVPRQARSLRGTLPNRYVRHYFPLQTEDIHRPLRLTLRLDPPQQVRLDTGLNVYVFDQDQMQAMLSRGLDPTRAPNTAAGTPRMEDGLPVWEVVIARPFPRYTVVVAHLAPHVAVSYRLDVENGLLFDPGGVAELQAPVVLAGAAVGGGGEGDDRLYTVRPGDTLSRIAQAVYGDWRLWEALCRHNGLADCDRLQVGQVLRLPRWGTATSSGPE